MMAIGGLALAAVAGTTAVFTMNDGGEVRSETASESASLTIEAVQEPPVRIAMRQDNDAPNTDVSEVDEPAPRKAPESIEFSLGSIDDLRAIQLTDLLEKIEAAPDVAEKTKVWVAEADIASPSGDETIYHVKGPLTCGRIGCDIIVIDGSSSVLLETVGEGISSPEMDTLIINEGSPTEVTWVFDGSEFVEK
ncbi:MAG: hypothetical protein HKP25_08305 [Marinicaulis sp.]|nr:hypothetical protein [Marinicaulis sp.]NNL89058.1 hypothetical protein [Marinicaulis sp.]